MKNCLWITLFFFLLLDQQLYCISNSTGENLSFKNLTHKNTSLISSENYNCLSGILPSSQVFFNIVPEVPVFFNTYIKAESFHRELNTLKTRSTNRLTHHQFSSFSRYCSGFIHIYLRTACFRL